MGTIWIHEGDYLFPAGETITIRNEPAFGFLAPSDRAHQVTGNLVIAGKVHVTAGPGSGAYDWSGLYAASDNSSDLFKVAKGGEVTVSTEFLGYAFVLRQSNSQPRSIVNDGYIELTSKDYGFAFEAWGEPRLENSGVIKVTAEAGAAAIRLVNGGTVINTGSIEVFSSGARSDQYAFHAGIQMLGFGGDFYNYGSIVAHVAAAGRESTAVIWSIYQGDSHWPEPFRPAAFVNAGRLEGDYALKATSEVYGPDYSREPWTETFTNTGVMAGKVSLGGSYATLANSGRITGAIDLGAGSDLYDGVRGQADSPVSGANGDDTLLGGAYSDTLFGDAGNDKIEGGGGADQLRGGESDDLIRGGDGFDDTHGNQGNDSVYGEGGPDWVVGGQGSDMLFGGEGDDVVYGNLGADTQEGGDGRDWVRGGQGDDSLSGGDGDDFMSGDRGNDTLYGGQGADRFNTFADSGIDRIMDFNSAQGDRVQFEGAPAYSLRFEGGDTIIDMGGGNQTILVGVTEASLGLWLA
ncbi:MAG: calcium-binding protein [Pseudomonadota bacterium]